MSALGDGAVRRLFEEPMECAEARAYERGKSEERERIIAWLRNVSTFDYYGEVFANAIENPETWKDDE